MPKASTKGKGKGKQQQSGGEYDNSNRGVLFPNDKEGNEARPDYTGHLEIPVGEYEQADNGNIKIRLAAWVTNNDRVGDYLRISASVPQSE